MYTQGMRPLLIWGVLGEKGPSSSSPMLHFLLLLGLLQCVRKVNEILSKVLSNSRICLSSLSPLPISLLHMIAFLTWNVPSLYLHLKNISEKWIKFSHIKSNSAVTSSIKMALMPELRGTHLLFPLLQKVAWSPLLLYSLTAACSRSIHFVPWKG